MTKTSGYQRGWREAFPWMVLTTLALVMAGAFAFSLTLDFLQVGPVPISLAGRMGHLSQRLQKEVLLWADARSPSERTRHLELAREAQTDLRQAAYALSIGNSRLGMAQGLRGEAADLLGGTFDHVDLLDRIVADLGDPSMQGNGTSDPGRDDVQAVQREGDEIELQAGRLVTLLEQQALADAQIEKDADFAFLVILLSLPPIVFLGYRILSGRIHAAQAGAQPMQLELTETPAIQSANSSEIENGLRPRWNSVSAYEG